MGDIVKSLFNVGFQFLGIEIKMDKMAQSIVDLSDFNALTKTSIWQITSSLQNLIIPTALSLLVLFTLVKFVKEALEIRNLTWERCVMIMIEFFIYKVLIENSFELLTTIMNITSDIFVGVNNTISATGNMTDVGEAIATLINNQGWLEQIVCVIVVLFLYIALAGTFIGIITQVLMNLVKLVMGFCVSPIPIAIGQFDGGGSNTCKNFFMWIASLGLTYTLILICVKIYTLGISSLSIANNFPVIGDFIGAMLGLICCNSLLLASVSYAPTLAEKLTGGR